MSLHVIASVVVLPEHNQPVADSLQALAEQSRLEPGNLRYDLYRDSIDANTFHLLETYIDQAAFDAHLQSPHFAAHLTHCEGCLAEPARIHVLHALNEQPSTV